MEGAPKCFLTVIEASDTVEFLAACFQNLKRATSFKEIRVDDDLYGLISAAFLTSSSTRSIAVFTVQSQYLAGPGFLNSSSSPTDSSPYTKGIDIVFSSLSYILCMSPESKQTKRNTTKCNYHKHHLKGYQTDYTVFSRFIEAYNQIEDAS